MLLLGHTLACIKCHGGMGSPLRGGYKTWTLDSGLDYGLDSGLDYGFNFELNWTLCCLKQTINARLPNEWRNGLTVGTGIYAAFGKD